MKIKIRVVSILVGVTIISISCMGLATYILTSADYITPSNQNFIGKEILDNNLNTGNELSTSSIVKKFSQAVLPPSSITEFPTKKINSHYVTPEIMLANGNMSIFTLPDTLGLTLKEGDILTFEFTKYESETTKNQNLLIGIIANGEVLQGEEFPQLSGTFEKQIDFDGEYYIYVINASSDPISLKEGTINKKNTIY